MFSYSKIKAVKNCPYKYKRNYIDKAYEPGSIYAIYGQAIHKVFKEIVMKKLGSKDATKIWRMTFESELSNNREIIVVKRYEFFLKRGYPMIQIFIKKLNDLKIESALHCEERMYGDYKSEKFCYVTDLIYKDPNNKITLIDYKTGKARVEDYYQLAFYKMLSKLEIEELILYYAFGQIIRFKFSKYANDAIKYIDSALEIIKKGDFYRIKNDNCKYCIFFVKECKGM